MPQQKDIRRMIAHERRRWERKRGRAVRDRYEQRQERALRDAHRWMRVEDAGREVDQ